MLNVTISKQTSPSNPKGFHNKGKMEAIKTLEVEQARPIFQDQDNIRSFAINPFSDRLMLSSQEKLKLYELSTKRYLAEYNLNRDDEEDDYGTSSKFVVKNIQALFLSNFWLVYFSKKCFIFFDDHLNASKVIFVEHSIDHIFVKQREEKFFVVKPDLKTIKCLKYDLKNYYNKDEDKKYNGNDKQGRAQKNKISDSSFKVALKKGKPNIILRSSCICAKVNEDLSLLAISTESSEVFIYQHQSDPKVTLNTTTTENCPKLHMPVLDWSQEFLFYADESQVVIFNYFKRAEVKRISTDLTSQGFMIDLIASQHSLDSGLVFVTSDYHIIDYSVQEKKIVDSVHLYEENSLLVDSSLHNRSSPMNSSNIYGNTYATSLVNSTQNNENHKKLLQDVNSKIRHILSSRIRLIPYLGSACNKFKVAFLVQQSSSKRSPFYFNFFEVKSSFKPHPLPKNEEPLINLCQERQLGHSGYKVIQVRDQKKFLVANSSLKIFNCDDGIEQKNVNLIDFAINYEMVDEFLQKIVGFENEVTSHFEADLMIFVVTFRQNILAIDLESGKVAEGSHELKNQIKQIKIIKKMKYLDSDAAVCMSPTQPEKTLLTMSDGVTVILFEMNFGSNFIKYFKHITLNTNAGIKGFYHDMVNNYLLLATERGELCYYTNRFYFFHDKIDLIWNNLTAVSFDSHDRIVVGFKSGDLQYMSLNNKKISISQYTVFSFGKSPIKDIKILHKRSGLPSGELSRVAGEGAGGSFKKDEETSIEREFKETLVALGAKKGMRKDEGIKGSKTDGIYFIALAENYTAGVWSVEKDALLAVVNMPSNIRDFGLFVNTKDRLEVIGITAFNLLRFDSKVLMPIKALCNKTSRAIFRDLLLKRQKKFYSSDKEMKRQQIYLTKKQYDLMDYYKEIERQSQDLQKSTKRASIFRFFEPKLYKKLFGKPYLNIPSGIYIDYQNTFTLKPAGKYGILDFQLDMLVNKEKHEKQIQSRVVIRKKKKKMVLFQNMKDEDVIDTILMDFPGLRKLTRESNEKKNFINKHILSAKYAIYHFQPSMSLDDQIEKIAYDCNYTALDPQLYSAFKANFERIRESQRRAKERMRYESKLEMAAKELYVDLQARNIVKNNKIVQQRKNFQIPPPQPNPKPRDFKIRRSNQNLKSKPKGFRGFRKTDISPIKARKSTNQVDSNPGGLKKQFTIDINQAKNLGILKTLKIGDSNRKTTIQNIFTLSSTNKTFFLTGLLDKAKAKRQELSTLPHSVVSSLTKTRSSINLHSVKTKQPGGRPVKLKEVDIIKPYLMGDQNELYKTLKYPALPKLGSQYYGALPGEVRSRIDSLSNLHYKSRLKRPESEKRDIVEMHSLGFSSLENHDLFNHLRRMMPSLHIYRLYNLQNSKFIISSVKTDDSEQRKQQLKRFIFGDAYDQDEDEDLLSTQFDGVGGYELTGEEKRKFEKLNQEIRHSQDLSSEEETFYRSILIKKVVLKSSQKQLIGLKKLIEHLENKQRRGMGDVPSSTKRLSDKNNVSRSRMLNLKKELSTQNLTIGVVSKDTLIQRKRVDKDGHVIGYSEQRFQRENTVIFNAIKNMKNVGPNALYEVKDILENRLRIVNNLIKEFSIEEELKAYQKRFRTKMERFSEFNTPRRQFNRSFDNLNVQFVEQEPFDTKEFLQNGQITISDESRLKQLRKTRSQMMSTYNMDSIKRRVQAESTKRITGLTGHTEGRKGTIEDDHLHQTSQSALGEIIGGTLGTELLPEDDDSSMVKIRPAGAKRPIKQNRVNFRIKINENTIESPRNGMVSTKSKGKFGMDSNRHQAGSNNYLLTSDRQHEEMMVVGGDSEISTPRSHQSQLDKAKTRRQRIDHQKSKVKFYRFVKQEVKRMRGMEDIIRNRTTRNPNNPINALKPEVGNEFFMDISKRGGELPQELKEDIYSFMTRDQRRNLGEDFLDGLRDELRLTTEMKTGQTSDSDFKDTTQMAQGSLQSDREDEELQRLASKENIQEVISQSRSRNRGNLTSDRPGSTISEKERTNATPNQEVREASRRLSFDKTKTSKSSNWRKKNKPQSKNLLEQGTLPLIRTDETPSHSQSAIDHSLEQSRDHKDNQSHFSNDLETHVYKKGEGAQNRMIPTPGEEEKSFGNLSSVKGITHLTKGSDNVAESLRRTGNQFDHDSGSRMESMLNTEHSPRIDTQITPSGGLGSGERVEDPLRSGRTGVLSSNRLDLRSGSRSKNQSRRNSNRGSRGGKVGSSSRNSKNYRKSKTNFLDIDSQGGKSPNPNSYRKFNTITSQGQNTNRKKPTEVIYSKSFLKHFRVIRGKITKHKVVLAKPKIYKVERGKFKMPRSKRGVLKFNPYSKLPTRPHSARKKDKKIVNNERKKLRRKNSAMLYDEKNTMVSRINRLELENKESLQDIVDDLKNWKKEMDQRTGGGGFQDASESEDEIKTSVAIDFSSIEAINTDREKKRKRRKNRRRGGRGSITGKVGSKRKSKGKSKGKKKKKKGKDGVKKKVSILSQSGGSFDSVLASIKGGVTPKGKGKGKGKKKKKRKTKMSIVGKRRDGKKDDSRGMEDLRKMMVKRPTMGSEDQEEFKKSRYGRMKDGLGTDREGKIEDDQKTQETERVPVKKITEAQKKKRNKLQEQLRKFAQLDTEHIEEALDRGKESSEVQEDPGLSTMRKKFDKQKTKKFMRYLDTIEIKTAEDKRKEQDEERKRLEAEKRRKIEEERIREEEMDAFKKELLTIDRKNLEHGSREIYKKLHNDIKGYEYGDMETDESKYRYYLYHKIIEQNNSLISSVDQMITDNILMRNNCDDELRKFFDLKIQKQYEVDESYKMKFISDFNLPAKVSPTKPRKKGPKVKINLNPKSSRKNHFGDMFERNNDDLRDNLGEADDLEERIRIFWDQYEYMDFYFKQIYVKKRNKANGVKHLTEKQLIEEEEDRKWKEFMIEKRKQEQAEELKKKKMLELEKRKSVRKSKLFPVEDGQALVGDEIDLEEFEQFPKDLIEQLKKEKFRLDHPLTIKFLRQFEFYKKRLRALNADDRKEFEDWIDKGIELVGEGEEVQGSNEQLGE